MAMKTASSPRRVYSTLGTLALCHKGLLYGFVAVNEGEKSALRKDIPALVTSTNEDGSIVVKQRRPHAKTVVETWFPLPNGLCTLRRQIRKGFACVNQPPADI